MKKLNKISTKIKLLGTLFVFLMISVIATTINLNQENIKDALVVNIVGKQRMLTQRISKNIFYNYYNSYKDFAELDLATQEFIKGLDILENGDKTIGISAVPTKEIATQLLKVNILWKSFYKNIEDFKLYSMSKDPYAKENLKKIVNSVYKKNNILLEDVDKLVTLYTEHSEQKTEYIRTFQYLAALTLLLLFIYSLFQLKTIEAHVDEFFTYTKKLINNKGKAKLEPIRLKEKSETEIIQARDTMNYFIEKVNSAMDFSNEALSQSKQAFDKLEELTDEFDLILNEFKNKSLISKHLNNSEDIVIESTEELINSTKKLENLKSELEKLTKTCQETSI